MRDAGPVLLLLWLLLASFFGVPEAGAGVALPDPDGGRGPRQQVARVPWGSPGPGQERASRARPWMRALRVGGEAMEAASSAAGGGIRPGDRIGFVVWLDTQAPPGTQIRRVSVASGPAGAEGDDHSREPAISADGRYVAFASQASNLVPGDTNGTWDVFVHDTQAGTTTRASVTADGTQAEGASDQPALSGDGRTLVFRSDAPNLIPGPPEANGVPDVYLRDLAGLAPPGLATLRVSATTSTPDPQGRSEGPDVNEDGSLVVFESDAPDLVAGDDNRTRDVFVYVRGTGEIRRVSVATGGTQASRYSLQARIAGRVGVVVFRSFADDLVEGSFFDDLAEVFAHDLATGTTTRVSMGPGGVAPDGQTFGRPSISADGNLVAFTSYAANLVPGDDNGAADVFVHDRSTQGTGRARTVDPGLTTPVTYAPALSGDGTKLAVVSLPLGRRDLCLGSTPSTGPPAGDAAPGSGQWNYFAYSPFGEPLQSDAAVPFGFQGLRRELAGPDELLSAQLRHASPRLGRWLSRDPGGFIDGPNRYRWNRNNPLRYFDDNGLRPVEWQDQLVGPNAEASFLDTLDYVEPLIARENARRQGLRSAFLRGARFQGALGATHGGAFGPWGAVLGGLGRGLAGGFWSAGAYLYQDAVGGDASTCGEQSTLDYLSEFSDSLFDPSGRGLGGPSISGGGRSGGGGRDQLVMEHGAGVPGTVAPGALPMILKAVNSKLPHAAGQGVIRGIFRDVRSGADALRRLSERVGRGDLPLGTIVDTARPDRILVPVGNGGYAVYQILGNGTLRLQTVLNAR